MTLQENGGRTGVRCVLLQSQAARALPVALAAFPTRGSAAMQLNVSPYSMAQLHAARHEFELHRGGLVEDPATAAVATLLPPGEQPLATHLVLDHAHMGVGGDDSWSPSTHEAYLVPPAAYSFSLALLPVRPEAAAP